MLSKNFHSRYALNKVNELINYYLLPTQEKQNGDAFNFKDNKKKSPTSKLKNLINKNSNKF